MTRKALEHGRLTLLLAILLLLPAYAETQELRIVYGNDNQGELLSCGCSYDIGGLARKAARLQALRTQNGGSPLLALDAGNLAFRKPELPAEAGQALAVRIRARGVVAANRQMGLGIAGIAANDLAAGPGFLRAIAGDGFTWLSANLVDSQSGALLFPAFTTVQAGQLRVTVLALTDPQARVPSGCRLRPWQEVLPQLVQKLRPEAHLLILLSNQPFTENKKIATACPGLDLIFQAGYTMGNLPPTQVGHALISQTSTRGKYLGLLHIDWQGPGRWRHQAGGALVPEGRAVSGFSQRFLPLDASLPDDAAMKTLVDEVERQARAAAR